MNSEIKFFKIVCRFPENITKFQTENLVLDTLLTTDLQLLPQLTVASLSFLLTAWKMDLDA